MAIERAARPNPPGADAASAGPPRIARAVRGALAPFDRLCDRLYGSRWNPLQQTGNLATLLFLVALGSGLYLFLFYRIADPHASVARIQNEIFLGSWMRAVHRYAADLALAAIVLHLLRKLAQGHTWGPRVLAWVSGVLLLGLTLLCGWSGLVLVWDRQSHQLAVAGARMLDLLPVLSEPLSRSFTGETPLSSSFFFMNLFLHVALPLGLAALLGVHVARLARPKLLPPRKMTLSWLGLLAAVAVLAPVPLAPEADLGAMPGRLSLDLAYSAWLPLAERISAPALLGLFAGAAVLLLAAPLLWRPRHAINTSWVDESSCTGCTTCAEDCPYEAIAMVPRSRWEVQSSELVARVDPARCVGCGICAGSCAPMGVGPLGRTGRDQLGRLRSLLASGELDDVEVVVLGCRQTLRGHGLALTAEGAYVWDIECAGSVHTSVIEQLLRRGVGGVMVLSCIPRGCSFREGPTWLEQRLFAGREAELPERVDRRRVVHLAAAPSEISHIRREVRAFAARLRTLREPATEAAVSLPECAASAKPMELVS